MTNPNFDKEDYKHLKSLAKADGVRFLVLTNSVVAYTKATHGQDCRMILVAVSWCAPEDTFKKKVGKYQALCKLYEQEHVQLPLAEDFDVQPFLLEDLLTSMFDI